MCLKSGFAQNPQTDTIKESPLDSLILQRAFSLYHLADSLYKAADYGTCIVYYEKSAKKYAEIKMWNKYVQCFSDIGFVLGLTAEYDKALAYLNAGLMTGIRELGTFHIAVAAIYNSLGEIYRYQGYFDKALDCYQKDYDITFKTYGNKGTYLVSNYNNMGMIFNQRGDYDKALEYYMKAITIFLMNPVPNQFDLAVINNNIGVVYKNMNNVNQAIEHHKRALELRLNIYGPEHPEVATSYNNLGVAYLDLDDYKLAMECYQKSFDIFLKTLAPDNPDIGMCYSNMGSLLTAFFAKPNIKKDAVLNGCGFPDALEYLSKSRDSYLKAYGTYHPSVSYAYNQLANYYNKQGECKEAIQYYQYSIKALVLGFDEDNIYVNPLLKRIHKQGEPTKIEGVNDLLGLMETLTGKGSLFFTKWMEEKE